MHLTDRYSLTGNRYRIYACRRACMIWKRGDLEVMVLYLRFKVSLIFLCKWVDAYGLLHYGVQSPKRVICVYDNRPDDSVGYSCLWVSVGWSMVCITWRMLD